MHTDMCCVCVCVCVCVCFGLYVLLGSVHNEAKTIHCFWYLEVGKVLYWSCGRAMCLCIGNL